MKLLRNSLFKLNKAVVTIGNFDGVHLGHQALISKVVAEARARKVPAVVITFEPQPFEYFNRGNVTVPRLTRLREKFYLLESLGVDYLYVLNFNEKLATLPAAEFAEKCIIAKFSPSQLILGDDFQFGYKRQGDIHLLKELGLKNNFTVDSMATFLINDERVSSTRVRAALQAGDLSLAKTLLGRPYSMIAKVRHGDKLGRTLGFPTANLFLHRKLTPLLGIYTVLVEGIADKALQGVASLGMRPTVGGRRVLLEVHLLNFQQDIYDKEVKVTFCHKLRDEVHYPTIDELKQQISLDVENAKRYFQFGDVHE